MPPGSPIWVGEDGEGRKVVTNFLNFARPEQVQLSRSSATPGDLGPEPLVEVDGDRAVSDVRMGLDGTRFRLASERWGARELRIPLIGAHQARNAAFAAELLAVLLPLAPTL